MRQMMGLGSSEKPYPVELAGDVEVQASLSYQMSIAAITGTLISVLITVDVYNTVRVYLQYLE
jgi:hypothetical protein